MTLFNSNMICTLYKAVQHSQTLLATWVISKNSKGAFEPLDYLEAYICERETLLFQEIP